MDIDSIRRALLGNGVLGNAADISTLYPVWQQAYTSANESGQPFPQFEEWVQMQRQQGLLGEQAQMDPRAGMMRNQM